MCVRQMFRGEIHSANLKDVNIYEVWLFVCVYFQRVVR